MTAFLVCHPEVIMKPGLPCSLHVGPDRPYRHSGRLDMLDFYWGLVIGAGCGVLIAGFLLGVSGNDLRHPETEPRAFPLGYMLLGSTAPHSSSWQTHSPPNSPCPIATRF